MISNGVDSFVLVMVDEEDFMVRVCYEFFDMRSLIS